MLYSKIVKIPSVSFLLFEFIKESCHRNSQSYMNGVGKKG